MLACVSAVTFPCCHLRYSSDFKELPAAPPAGIWTRSRFRDDEGDIS